MFFYFCGDGEGEAKAAVVLGKRHAWGPGWDTGPGHRLLGVSAVVFLSPAPPTALVPAVLDWKGAGLVSGDGRSDQPASQEGNQPVGDLHPLIYIHLF